MKVLLVGAGAQGKACVLDLLKNKKIKGITVLDSNTKSIRDFLKKHGKKKVIVKKIDANNKELMISYFKKHDIIIDLLPTQFRKYMTKLAIDAERNIVNTSYQSHIKNLENEAMHKGIIVMPEAGVDPGIDLVLAGHAVDKFDKVESFDSATGGIPENMECGNPLHYKINWSFPGVLSAYKRKANLIVNGKVVRIPGEEIFNHMNIIEIEGVGKLERYPNGFSTTYAKLLGIRDNVINMGRYTLRWPGHVDFWKKMVDLGIIDEKPVYGIVPREYFAKLLEPKLQYEDKERDMIVMYNEMIGWKDGRRKRIIQKLLDYRDLKTGLFAMNRTVGFTASIVAQMILEGKIKGKGILNPTKDIPRELFFKELKKRKIVIQETEEWMDVV